MATDVGVPVSIHATAVAIAGRALLILGPSGAGKSALAVSLMAASTRRCPILLVGDDRVLLSRRGEDWLARGHPRILGFVERRGIGIFACPFLPFAPIAGVVELGPTPSRIEPLQNFPRLRFVDASESARDVVLAWWRDPSTTQAGKASGAV